MRGDKQLHSKSIILHVPIKNSSPHTHTGTDHACITLGVYMQVEPKTTGTEIKNNSLSVYA